MFGKKLNCFLWMCSLSSELYFYYTYFFLCNISVVEEHPSFTQKKKEEQAILAGGPLCG